MRLISSSEAIAAAPPCFHRVDAMMRAALIVALGCSSCAPGSRPHAAPAPAPGAPSKLTGQLDRSPSVPPSSSPRAPSRHRFGALSVVEHPVFDDPSLRLPTESATSIDAYN